MKFNRMRQALEEVEFANPSRYHFWEFFYNWMNPDFEAHLQQRMRTGLRETLR